jgi:CheY-like chemotaxis protein
MARILLIEDEQPVRDLIHLVLERVGHEVVDAPDGSVGAALFHARPPDLIITDILMPVKEGLAVIREVKRDHPSTPILAMSGGSSRTDYDPLPVAEMLGADRTMSKPLDLPALLQAVEELLAATA